MKIKTLFLAAFLCAMSFLSSGQHFTKPDDYLIFIDKNQKEIVLDIISYTSDLTHGKNVKTEKLERKKIMQKLRSSSLHIKGMPAFKNDRTLQDSFVVFAQSAYKVFEVDFATIEKMQDSVTKTWSQAYRFAKSKETAMNVLLKEDADFDDAVSKFATKYEAKVPRNFEDQYQDLLAIRDIGKQENTLYLMFLKCYKQESELAKVIITEKVEAIKSGNDSLALYVKQGLASLDAIKPYEEYTELLETTKELLNSYKNESEVKVPLLLKSLEIEAPKAITDSTANTNQAIVTSTVVTDKAVLYLNTKKEMDAERLTFLPKWHKASHKFLKKFLPT